MSCRDVPTEFQFVDVTYADPEFTVTPSTGPMRVEGKVVDIARSELGFQTLVVLASSVRH